MKDDYRDDFLAESHYKVTPLHLESFNGILQFKSELIRRYEHGAYFIEDKHIRLPWSWHQYAQVNKLNMMLGNPPPPPSLIREKTDTEEDFNWQEVISKLATEKPASFSTSRERLKITNQSLRDRVGKAFLENYPNHAKRLPEAIWQRMCGEVDVYLQEQIKLEEVVNRHYKPQKAAAVQDFQAIRDAIRNAEAVWGSSRKGKQQPQVVFTVRLHCDLVIPYKTDDDEVEPKNLRKSVA